MPDFFRLAYRETISINKIICAIIPLTVEKTLQPASRLLIARSKYDSLTLCLQKNKYENIYGKTNFFFIIYGSRHYL